MIDNLKVLYQQAGGLRYWMVVRYCSSLLHHTVDSISPFITGVLVKGKQVHYFLLTLVNFALVQQRYKLGSNSKPFV